MKPIGRRDQQRQQGAADAAVPLTRLLAAVPNLLGVSSGRAGEDGWIRGLTADSRSVRPGDCFVAIRGTRLDGHAYVDEAVRRGAAAVVVDRPEVSRRLASLEPRLPVALVGDSRLALAWMAAAWYRHPSEALHVVGVTGTVGKTSTALYARQLLETAGIPTGAVGTLGIFTSTGWRPSELTTPDPMTLQAALRAMADEGLHAATLEVSSHALLQHRAASMRLRTGVLTEMAPHEHVDVHPTFEAYLQAKARLLDLLDPEAILVYHAGNTHARTLAARWPAPQRIGYQLRDGSATLGVGPAEGDGARVEGRIRGLDLAGIALDLHVAVDARPALTMPVHLSLVGPQAALAAVGAAAVALAMGVPPEALRHGLAGLQPLRRRTEVLMREPFVVIDDTAAHPASLERLLGTLAACRARGIVLLMGIRGSRGVEINARNGQVVAAWSHRLPIEAIVVTDAEEAVGPRDRVLPEERRAVLSALASGPIPPLHLPGLEQAVAAALQRVRPGGVLVMTGTQALDGAASLLLRRLGREDGAGRVEV